MLAGILFSLLKRKLNEKESYENLQNNFHLNLSHSLNFGDVEIFNFFSYEYFLVTVLDDTENLLWNLNIVISFYLTLICLIVGGGSMIVKM